MVVDPNGHRTRFRIELRTSEQTLLENYVQTRGSCAITPVLEAPTESEENLYAVREHFMRALSVLDETDRRHLLAGPQSALGHSERIDAVLRDGERSWVRLGHAGFSVWPNGWEVKTVALRRDGAVRWNGIAAT